MREAVQTDSTPPMTKADAFAEVWSMLKAGYMYDLESRSWRLYYAIGHRRIDMPPKWVCAEVYAAWRVIHERSQLPRTYEYFLSKENP